ncbi:outer membrane protein transport protein [Mameliella sp. CS4]|uniref:OmpP1/FadL family transporter n=1 Tax=Mameliella sp. CS4 TaxID=2862329 RepID=UPI001C5D49E2|nr:outer membrane protein transport protein [Mameliella sp. CS4]MBW4983389.1 outer membrane protein transport protein [Mameliella sp. CS4]
MKKRLIGVGALALAPLAAQAGGIDRSGQSIGVIFEQGTYAELSFGSVSTDVSGVQVVTFPPALGGSTAGSKSGNMTNDYLQFGAALKHDYNDKFSVALIFEQPFGADVEYDTGTGYFASSATAKLQSEGLTAVARYKFNENFSVHGGVRYQRLTAEAFIPYITLPAGPLAGTPYSADTERDAGWGYLLGAAYERPDIALRVALTYNSGIQHDLPTVENSAIGLANSSTTGIKTPQSVNLEFQTGIAPDTLLFGSVRWVDWSEFEIRPTDYDTLTGTLAGGPGVALVSYKDDTITYNLGVGRRFTENWAGSVSVGYEPANSNFASNLGPTNGNWSVGLGAAYTKGMYEISGGVRYVQIGKAETEVGPFSPATSFDDNHAIGVGMKFAVNF